jgi:hypothetical protein
LLKFGKLLRRRKLRLITLRINHAEEAERLVSGRPKLMPGHGWDRDQVVGGDLAHLAADQTVPVTAQDQNVVGVLMALEGGEASRRDLEIAQFAAVGGRRTAPGG